MLYKIINIILGLGIFIGIFCNEAYSQASPRLLTDINVSRNKSIEQVEVSFQFEGQFDDKSVKVNYLSNYIQIQFLNAYTLDTTKFVKGMADIKRVFLLQAKPDVVMARLIMKKEAKSYKQFFDLKVQNNLVTATVPFIPVVQAENVKEDFLPKSTVPMTHASSSLFNVDPLLIEKGTIISIFLLVLIIVSILFKRFINPVRKLNTHEPIIKPLAKYALDAKKTLVLMEVDGEQILIGVTPENISMLKVMNSKDEIAPIKEDLLDKEKNPTVKKKKTIHQNKTSSTNKLVKKTSSSNELAKKSIVNLVKKIQKKAPINPYGKFSNYVESNDVNQEEVKVTPEANVEDTIQDVTEMIRNKLSTMQSIQKGIS